MDLTQFIDAYRGPLIGLIASWGAPWGEAAEIAQDSFSQAWISRESCRGDWRNAEVFGRWLRGVALNTYRQWAKSQGRRRKHLVMVEQAVLEQAAAPAEGDMTEYLDALRQSIEALPTKQREVVLMHYLEETSVKEVAALLSVSVKSVEGRLFQARQRLRVLLNDRLPFAQRVTTSRILRMLLCL